MRLAAYAAERSNVVHALRMATLPEAIGLGFAWHFTSEHYLRGHCNQCFTAA